jgi:uncharacterized protein (TIGR02453 family)
MTEFTGFPMAALDFYEDLEHNNSKAFWDEHKKVFTEQIATPMKALAAALEPEFGPAKIFRPNRDVRFSADKSPYKTHHGAYVAGAGPVGWYVQISASGMMVGGGFYEAGPPQLAIVRAAIDDDVSGPELEKLMAKYATDGWDIGGDEVKTAPRGYPKDHPRIELLRKKSLWVGRDYGHEGVDKPEILDRIRADWNALRPLNAWFEARDLPPMQMDR